MKRLAWDGFYQTGEFIALSARSLYHALGGSQGDLPDGISFSAVVEDCWKGYRQNFASMADRRFCIFTFVHPHSKKSVYQQLFGLLFGFGVVVNQFAVHHTSSRQWPAASWLCSLLTTLTTTAWWIL
eukprot:2686177-Amphidinium_carterae.1